MKTSNKLILLIPIFLSHLIMAQPSPFSQWGNLKPGPYGIGYRTIRTVDYTRNYFSSGRPIQIYMWYPTVSKPEAEKMKFGGYFDDIVYDWGDNAQKVAYLKQSLIKEFKSGALNPSFPGELSEQQFEKILDTPLPVVRDAMPAQGKFPVLLHMHANGVLHQSLMMEYLASYGYVVMSISMYGSSPAFYGRGEEGANALLNLTQDLAFVLAQAKTLDYAATENATMIGMTAPVGMSLQFKEMSLKAIASHDGFWNPSLMKQLPYFDPKRIRIPVLEFINTDFADQQKIFLDSLPYAERFIGRFHQFLHADFYPFPKIAHPETSSQYLNYEFILTSILHFLNAVLKNDESGKEYLNHPDYLDLPADFVTIRKEPAQKMVPTENELLTWLRYGEMQKVQEAWKAVGKSLVTQDKMFSISLFLARDHEPHAYQACKMYLSAFPTNPRNTMIFNLLGYNLLQAKQLEKAADIFKLYIKQFPESPYAYDGLSEVYTARGDQEKAKISAQKVIELLDTIQPIPHDREKLLKNAQQKINR